MRALQRSRSMEWNGGVVVHALQRAHSTECKSGEGAQPLPDKTPAAPRSKVLTGVGTARDHALVSAGMTSGCPGPAPYCRRTWRRDKMMGRH